MSKVNSRIRNQRHAFLLTFFSESDVSGSHKEVNGFILQKQWNGNVKEWQVAIYPKSSWKSYQIEPNETLDWIK